MDFLFEIWNFFRLQAPSVFSVLKCFVFPPPGAVFTEETLQQEIAFKLAVKRINMERIILPNSVLVPKVEHIQKHDSFHADKKGKSLVNTPLSPLSPLLEFIFYFKK